MKNEEHDSAGLDDARVEITELRTKLEAIEREVMPNLRKLEIVELLLDVAPPRACERFWGSALGPWHPVLQDRAFADLVDFIEQEGEEHIGALLVLFQRATSADASILAAAVRLDSQVTDLGWRGPGSTGPAHQVSVDLDFLSTHPAGAWREPSKALGPSPSATRDLLVLARARQARGECPLWVVATLKAAAEDE